MGEAAAMAGDVTEVGKNAPANVAIMFDADGYQTDGPKLMGRQMAGNGFLRAAVASAATANRLLVSYSPSRTSAEKFAEMTRSFRPEVGLGWVPADQPNGLGGIGTLYVPDPGLGEHARRRLRSGVAAYSLCGVTHTISSHGAMESIAGLLSAPVMPWDALICTSKAAGSAVKEVLEKEIEALRWRFGAAARITPPVLPVIPLGVHCDDFVFTPDERAAARAALGIAGDAVVALFVGRLSFHAKAHPWQMFVGLQAAAEKARKPVTLIQYGRFSNQAIGAAFRNGAEMGCPDVTSLIVDGQDLAAGRQCWAAADIFVSLSDNIQESFGLTPVEAMAAGLPVVVSDWDGYKDTVRDDEDGFRIPTWMPPPELGETLARRYESNAENYDHYCGKTCLTVSVDATVLADRLTRLITDPDLRRRMGASAAKRARETYDWSVVYRRYEELWAELAVKRRNALADPAFAQWIGEAPKVASTRLDPFRVFQNHPTRQITPECLVTLTRGATGAAYRHFQKDGLFNYGDWILPPPELVETLFTALKTGGETQVKALAEASGESAGRLVLVLSVLAKMGLVGLRWP